MLIKLDITNYALIESLSIRFDRGINILTGETGAGKSIILGALGLILGQRAENNALLHEDKKCVVEALFNLKATDFQPFFVINDIDYAAESLVRREILPGGRSRAFINDTPVTLPILKEFSSRLVNLIAQHQTLFLHQRSFKYRFVDAVAGNESLLATYKSDYTSWSKSKTELNKLVAAQTEWQKEIDYVQFQLDEFEKTNLTDPDEQTTIETELKKLDHSAELKSIFHELDQLQKAEHGGLQYTIRRMIQLYTKAAGYDKSIAPLLARLDSIFTELQDIDSETESLAELVNIDPEKVEQYRARLDTIYRLCKKHNVQSIAELQAIELSLSQKSLDQKDLDNQIESLKKSIAILEKKCADIAAMLYENRKKAATLIEKQMDKLLPSVAMKDAQFQVLITPSEMNDMGNDEIKLMFSANKGKNLAEVQEVASGGELSRLMLCIQAVLSKATDLPTLIMDEIDSGISGETALKTATVIKQIGLHHQLIIITHLPQIAACAEQHFLVYKLTDNNRTLSNVRPLTKDERVQEIAKMLSGENPSKTAIAIAQELISTVGKS